MLYFVSLVGIQGTATAYHYHRSIASLNFFFHDIAGTILAATIMPVFLLVPGYILGHILNIWQFQQRSLPVRIALGLVLSIAVTPGLTYLMARALSFEFACAVFVMISLAFFGVTAKAVIRSGMAPYVDRFSLNGIVRWLALVVVAWMCLAALLLSDLQLSDRVYPNVLSFDYTWRIAVTGSITRTGIPPVNPEFYPGHPLPLFYYYFWFMTCSLTDLLGGSSVEPRTAVMAGTVWIGVGLMAIVALYVRLLTPHVDTAQTRRVLIAVLLLCITGFDILPIVATYVYQSMHDGVILYPTVEWWNEQITAWPTATLWVPHHVAALIATLTAFLAFSSLRESSTTRERLLRIATCSLALFSALGLSVWITFTFAAFWVVWIILSWRKGWSGEARDGILVGLLAIVLSAPYVVDLRRAHTTSDSPVAVSVRPFLPVHDWIKRQGGGPNRLLVGDLISLPMNYLLELGFFAVAGLFYWRHRLRSTEKLSRDEMALVSLAATAAVIITFLRSRIANNDLGWRGAMFLQFALLIWSSDLTTSMFAHWFYKRRDVRIRLSKPVARCLLLAMMIGVFPIVYDVVMMKLYPAMGDLRIRVTRIRGFLDEADLGRRYHDVRLAYHWMNNHLPRSAIVQHNPDVYLDLPSGLYGTHQVVAADSIYGTHGTMFGVPVSVYEPVESILTALFRSGRIDRSEVAQICERFGITALLAKDTDAVWNDREGWLYRVTPLYENRSTRVVSCESFR